MFLRLPLYSQYLDIANKEWRNRGCGIIALKTVMDYWFGEEIVTGSKLFREGLESNGYIRRIGWKHDALVTLAIKYGFFAVRLESKKSSSKIAIQKLAKAVKKGPVIVSVWSNFSQTSRNSHLIVVYKINKNKVFYLDPASKKRKEIKRFTSLKVFAKAWRRLYIVVRPVKIK